MNSYGALLLKNCNCSADTQRTSGRKQTLILHKCSRNNVPVEWRRGGEIKTYFWLFHARVTLIFPQCLPSLPSSSYTSTDTIRDPKKNRGKRHIRDSFLSLWNWKIPEISPTSSLPPGPCRSVVTGCSFEVTFKAASERKCARHLGGRNMMLLFPHGKRDGCWMDTEREGGRPFS